MKDKLLVAMIKKSFAFVNRVSSSWILMKVYCIRLQWQRNLTHNLFIKIKLKKEGKKPIINYFNHYCKFYKRKKKQKQKRRQNLIPFVEHGFGNREK